MGLRRAGHSGIGGRIDALMVSLCKIVPTQIAVENFFF